MAATVWIDRKIASAVISNTVQYDNLSRRHNIRARWMAASKTRGLQTTRWKFGSG